MQGARDVAERRTEDRRGAARREGRGIEGLSGRPEIRTRDQARRELVANLAWIEAQARTVSMRRGFADHEAEEFSAWARLKLVDEDYSLMRQYRGRGRLRTFLRRVIGNLFRDYCDQKWGRWRPSVQARRQPCPGATLLEQLYCRDQLPLNEALELVLRNRQTRMSEPDLRRFAATLPAHPPRRFLSEAPLTDLAGEVSSADRLENREKARLARRVRRVLDHCLAALPPEDLTILALHFLVGRTIAAIAQELDLDQRRLYRRRDRCLKSLREGLERAGVGRGQVAELVGWPQLEAAWTGGGDALSESPAPPTASSLPAAPVAEASKGSAGSGRRDAVTVVGGAR